MRAGAYEWFLERVRSGSTAFTCYIASGDTFHARRLDRSSVDEPGSIQEIRLALEGMPLAHPEIGSWEVTIEEVSKHIRRLTFRPAQAP